MLYVDSLPAVKFPYQSDDYNRDFPVIDLTEFKHKNFFKLKFTRILTVIDGGGIDDDRIGSTFNLTDDGRPCRD